MRTRLSLAFTGAAAGLVATLLSQNGWTQTGTAAPPTPGPPGAGMPPDGGLTAVLVGFVVVALLLIVGAVMWFDRRRRRESEAVALQGRLSDALMRDPLLADLPVVVTVTLPTWSGTPATVDVRGDVPSPELRDQVVRFVAREATSLRTDCRIEDRLMVLPDMARVRAG